VWVSCPRKAAHRSSKKLSRSAGSILQRRCRPRRMSGRIDHAPSWSSWSSSNSIFSRSRFVGLDGGAVNPLVTGSGFDGRERFTNVDHCNSLWSFATRSDFGPKSGLVQGQSVTCAKVRIPALAYLRRRYGPGILLLGRRHHQPLSLPATWFLTKKTWREKSEPPR
jgi:hypothetical protein